MTILDPGKDAVVHGYSLEGETWVETFLRLQRTILPPGAPDRQIVDSESSVGRLRGATTNKVVTCYKDPTGRVVTEPPVILRTRPGQF